MARSPPCRKAQERSRRRGSLAHTRRVVGRRPWSISRPVKAVVPDMTPQVRSVRSAASGPASSSSCSSPLSTSICAAPPPASGSACRTRGKDSSGTAGKLRGLVGGLRPKTTASATANHHWRAASAGRGSCAIAATHRREQGHAESPSTSLLAPGHLDTPSGRAPPTLASAASSAPIPREKPTRRERQVHEGEVHNRSVRIQAQEGTAAVTPRMCGIGQGDMAQPVFHRLATAVPPSGAPHPRLIACASPLPPPPSWASLRPIRQSRPSCQSHPRGPQE